jgi:hypothetical protein
MQSMLLCSIEPGAESLWKHGPALVRWDRIINERSTQIIPRRSNGGCQYYCIAALRLTSALHDIHVSACPWDRSDFDTNMNGSSHVTDRLIWACNGFCSKCYGAYLPQVLTELPEPGLKAILQLIKYLQ